MRASNSSSVADEGAFESCARPPSTQETGSALPPRSVSARREGGGGS